MKTRTFLKKFVLIAVVFAVTISFLFNTIVVLGQVLFNGVRDTTYTQAGNISAVSRIGPSQFDDNFVFSPMEVSYYKHEPLELSYERVINKPNEWTISYSFGQVTEWADQDPYLDLFDFAYSNWANDPTTGFGFAITTENGLTIWTSWYDKSGEFNWSVWNPINGWHKPELRG